MHLFYFDCGTSRTRGYLLKDGNIITQHKKNIGSKDVSIHKDKDLLTKAMKEIYDILLEKKGLKDDDISCIYASGMITSTYGLRTVPHVVTPLNKKKLKDAIYVFKEDTLFQREIHLIPGMKSVELQGTLENIDQINNVRGEEIEAIGICNHIPRSWKTSKYVILLPGSHTHAILAEGETILDIYSNFSGELFHAVTTSTILSDSTKIFEHIDRQIDIHAVSKGCENLKKYGIARAIYIIHAMKIFNIKDNETRRDCLSGVITGSVVQSIALNIKNNWKDVEHIVLYGDTDTISIYKEALRHFGSQSIEKVITLNRNEINCSVEGLITIINS